MTTNHNTNSDRLPELVANSTGEHWIFFLVEGATLILLGLLAIIVPSFTDANVTAVLGWLFLIGGAIGLATTYWTRRAPGFWWSLVSALLAISCRHGPDRAQSSGSVWRSDGMAI